MAKPPLTESNDGYGSGRNDMSVDAAMLRRMSCTTMTLVLMLSLIACAGAGQTAPTNGEPFGWAALEPKLLPLLRNTKAFQASSSDPTGGNDDKGHFVKVTASTATLLDVKGRGCIYRIWSANPMGELRIYIDGESEPTIQMPFRRLFDRRQMPFVEPLVGREGGGGYCYMPFPFNRSARIDVVNPSSLYYQIIYHLSASNAATSQLEPSEGFNALRRWMSMPHGNKPTKQSELTIPPKTEKTLLKFVGPAMLVCLSLQVHPTTLKAMHSIRLRAFWDGEVSPSIDVPIADLMCIPFGWVRFKSAFVDTDGDWLTLRIPMPFSRSAKLTAMNDGNEAITVRCNAWIEPLSMRAKSFGTLHAWFNCEKTKLGMPHMLLRINGFGQLVGFSLTVDGKSLDCYEGDLSIKVDDDVIASIRGTGTEDEVNGGWYFINGEYATPFAGAPLLLSAKRRASLYRWMVADCIPFRRHIEASIEHGPSNNCPECTYRSVAIWYQLEPHSSLPSPPPLEMRLPVPFNEPEAIEAEEAMPKPIAPNNRCKISLIDDDNLPVQLSGGRGIAIMGSSPTSLTLPITVEKQSFYEIALRCFAATDVVVASSVNDYKVAVLKLRKGLRKGRLLRCKLDKGKADVKLTLQSQDKSDISIVIDYLQLVPLERARGATEAEELKVVEGACDVKWQGSSAIAPYKISPIWEGEWREQVDLSGGGYVSFEPARHGRRLSFEFDVTADGSYEFALGLLTNTMCGQFRAFVDGRPLGRAFSGRTKAEYAWHQIGLGVSQPLRSGKHRLTIESLDGKPLFIDYIVIQPAIAGYQAERMFIISSSRQTKIRKRFGAEPPWRGGAYLKLEAKSTGEHAKLLLPVFKSGIYNMSATIACMPSGGKFEVLVDGVKVGKPVDSYSEAEAQREVELGSVKLRRGSHEVMLHVIGKNTASGGYTIGCDEFELELVKALLELEQTAIALLACLIALLIFTGILLKRRHRRLRQNANEQPPLGT